MKLDTTALLFGSSLIQQEPFFAGLQGLAFVSAIMIFFALSQAINISVFVILSFIFTIIYFNKHKPSLANIGAFIGLVSLCLGMLLAKNQFMLVSGVLLAIYAVFSIKQGFSVGWVFLILNILFAIVAANTLYGFY